MPVVAVINRKGGSGKTTLSVHLAAHLARLGEAVVLGDVDRQLSTHEWLKRREMQPLPARRGSIVGRPIDVRGAVRVPHGSMVLDTPGGLRGFELARVVMCADAILMPVCNSVFDRESAAECYAELKTLPRVASGRCKVAVVGMRVDTRTKAARTLTEWAARQELQFLGCLRESQVYVQCLELGFTLFDLKPANLEADLAQWEPILQWVTPILLPPQRQDSPRQTTIPAALDMAEPPPRKAPQPVRRPAVTQEAVLRQLDEVERLQRQFRPKPNGHVAGAGLTDRLASWVGGLPRFLQRHPQASR